MKPSPAESAAAAPLDDCWNRIGVRGDRSCPVLAEHGHCRNCPVHAAAAVRLLEAAPPAGYLDEWTRHFAREEEDEAARTGTVVIFRLGREWLALPTGLFREIAPLRAVHALPHRRDGIVAGLVNVRGELLVCVALDRLLAVEPADAEAARGRHPRLLVIGRKAERVVFRADEVHGIHRFDPRELQETPVSLARGTAVYTTAMLPWSGRAVGCLDERRLLQTLNRALA